MKLQPKSSVTHTATTSTRGLAYFWYCATGNPEKHLKEGKEGKEEESERRTEKELERNTGSTILLNVQKPVSSVISRIIYHLQILFRIII